MRLYRSILILSVFLTSSAWAGNGERQIDRITPPPSGPVTLAAEYDPQEGVLVRYPYYYGQTIFSSMVDAIQDVAIVYILVANSTQQQNCINYLSNYGVPLDNVVFILRSTNTVWIRDYGPWFVTQEDSSKAIIDMPYAWNPSWTLDDYVPEFLESYWGLDYYGPDFWHDGGNMMTDGHGTMMMTTYVNESNPGMSNAEICQIYQDYFGQDTIYIFQEISGDVTGHIDLWAKIMNDTTILVARMQTNDANYALVEQHAAYLATIPSVYGTPFRIVRCPMPPRTSAYKSYLNSLLVNGRALVPIYNLSYDAEALAAYQEALGPEWDVIGIDCNAIYTAGGAIHCTTIGVPLHPWDFQINVSLSCEPINPPITIPTNGGQFSYHLVVQNLESHSVQFDLWTAIEMPNGRIREPALLRQNLSLSAGQTLDRTLTQNIPGFAPAGDYQYVAYVGERVPPVFSAQASFPFQKLVVEGWGPGAGDWSCGGLEIATLPGAGEIPALQVGCSPNPFNPTTAINFQLSVFSYIRLQVYDTAGRLVATLADGWKDAGEHQINFDAAELPSGVYLYRLRAGEELVAGKMVLLK